MAAESQGERARALLDAALAPEFKSAPPVTPVTRLSVAAPVTKAELERELNAVVRAIKQQIAPVVAATGDALHSIEHKLELFAARLAVLEAKAPPSTDGIRKELNRLATEVSFLKLDCIRICGSHESGKTYSRGNVVDVAGAWWLATDATNETPGLGRIWRRIDL